MSEKVKVVNHGGIGFWSLLSVVLIALKITGQIQVSWWIILGCMFAPLIFFAGIMLVAVIIAVPSAMICAIADLLGRKK